METPTVELDELAHANWSSEEARNAELVAEFVQLLMNEHDFAAVRDRFSEGPYTQHNHSMADGLEGVIETVSDLVKRFPDYAYEVHHIAVDGDFVFFHSHATLRTSHRGNARKGFNISDRWRVVDGKIVEHWDSIQPMDLFARFYALVSGGRVRNDNGTY